MSRYTIKYKGIEFPASQYQDAIFDNIEHGVGNMIIKAAAGSAKTTTIVNCMQIIPKNKSVLFIAFNKDIVDEIRSRVTERKGVKITTFHSLGLSILKENGLKMDSFTVNEFKYKHFVRLNISSLSDGIYDNLVGAEKQIYLNNILLLSDYCRYYMAFSVKEIEKVSDKYGIVPIANEFQVVPKVLVWGENEKGEIDYTDMVWLPNTLNYATRKYRFDWILIDEAQDVTIAEQNLIEKTYKRGCRVVVTGDPSQMINVWCGSDEEAINNFSRMNRIKEFTLPISYRCPKKVVELAKSYSPNITCADYAIDGVVRYNVSKNDPRGGDMVLCRITSPLIELHLHYLSINKKSYLIGSEKIMEQYLSLVRSTDSEVVDKSMIFRNGLFTSLYRLFIERVDNVINTYKVTEDDAVLHPSVMYVYDGIQGLKVLSAGITTVSELRNKIGVVLGGGEKEGVVLSTVHKAKGLEADNVYILNPSMMPIKYAKKNWEVKTEMNLIYVAITRAKKSLNYIEEERRFGGKQDISLSDKVRRELLMARKILSKWDDGNGDGNESGSTIVFDSFPELKELDKIGETNKKNKRFRLF